MKIKQSISVLMTTLLMITVAWAAERSTTRPNSRDRIEVVNPSRSSNRGPSHDARGDYQRRLSELEGRLRRLRAEHNTLLHTLREIHAVAESEKAPDTVARLNALIQERTEEHEEQVRHMERGLDQLRSVVQRLQDRKAVNRAGSKAPKFRLKGSDGKTVGLEGLTGKVVVLQWVNPDCPITKGYYGRKTPQTLASKYRDKGVVWLGINSSAGQTMEENRGFAEAFDLEFPILEDTAGVIARAYGAKCTPHVFIVDAGGTIAYNGAVDDSTRSSRAKKKIVTHFVDEALAALVAGDTVKVPFTQPVGMPIVRR